MRHCPFRRQSRVSAPSAVSCTAATYLAVVFLEFVSYGLTRRVVVRSVNCFARYVMCLMDLTVANEFLAFRLSLCRIWHSHDTPLAARATISLGNGNANPISLAGLAIYIGVALVVLLLDATWPFLVLRSGSIYQRLAGAV